MPRRPLKRELILSEKREQQLELRWLLHILKVEAWRAEDDDDSDEEEEEEEEESSEDEEEETSETKSVTKLILQKDHELYRKLCDDQTVVVHEIILS